MWITLSILLQSRAICHAAYRVCHAATPFRVISSVLKPKRRHEETMTFAYYIIIFSHPTTMVIHSLFDRSDHAERILCVIVVRLPRCGAKQSKKPPLEERTTWYAHKLVPRAYFSVLNS